MARRPSPPGQNVKLPALLHAECTLIAAEMGFPNLGQWLERAAASQLKADREAMKINRYRLDRGEAERDRHRSMPYAADYGLPPDFDMPDALPAPLAFLPFRR
jgi:hypothetical protein